VFDLTNASIVDITPSTFHDNQNQVDHSLKEQRSIPSKIAKPVRPVEFSLWVAIPFVNLFVGLAVVLGILYGKAYTKGTSLRIVRSRARCLFYSTSEHTDK